MSERTSRRNAGGRALIVRYRTDENAPFCNLCAAGVLGLLWR
jgi:hypothetical protein